MQLKEREIEIAARTLVGEDNNPEGWKAIAWVMRNRVNKPSWWGTSLIEVCLKPYQFSCWLNGQDGHRNFLRMMSEEDIHLPRTIIVSTFLTLQPDPTKGATHYHAESIVRPAAFDGLELIGKFGHNIFYKEI